MIIFKTKCKTQFQTQTWFQTLNIDIVYCTVQLAYCTVLMYFTENKKIRINKALLFLRLQLTSLPTQRIQSITQSLTQSFNQSIKFVQSAFTKITSERPAYFVQFIRLLRQISGHSIHTFSYRKDLYFYIERTFIITCSNSSLKCMRAQILSQFFIVLRIGATTQVEKNARACGHRNANLLI